MLLPSAFHSVLHHFVFESDLCRYHPVGRFYLLISLFLCWWIFRLCPAFNYCEYLLKRVTLGCVPSCGISKGKCMHESQFSFSVLLNCLQHGFTNLWPNVDFSVWELLAMYVRHFKRKHHSWTRNSNSKNWSWVQWVQSFFFTKVPVALIFIEWKILTTASRCLIIGD